MDMNKEELKTILKFAKVQAHWYDVNAKRPPNFEWPEGTDATKYPKQAELWARIVFKLEFYLEGK